MNVRSNIGASLNKKRQASFFKKLLAYFIFLIIILSLAIWGLNNAKAQIKTITVSGNASVSTEDIMKLADSELNYHHLLVIPTNNILLLRRDQIENDIVNNIPKIYFANVSIKGINKIEIIVKERKAAGLWCKGVPISNPVDCYFMDLNGFIFEKAATSSGNVFPEYFGQIMMANPVGQFYFKDNFKNISGLYGSLKNMSFEPQYFNAANKNEYEVYILGGGKILFDNEESFQSSLTNLQALVDNGYIKTASSSLQKLNYIDLRFGNKVPFEMNK